MGSPREGGAAPASRGIVRPLLRAVSTVVVVSASAFFLYLLWDGGWFEAVATFDGDGSTLLALALICVEFAAAASAPLAWAVRATWTDVVLGLFTVVQLLLVLAVVLFFVALAMSGPMRMF